MKFYCETSVGIKDSELYAKKITFAKKIILKKIKQNRSARTNENQVTLYYNQNGKNKQEEFLWSYNRFINNLYIHIYHSVRGAVSDIHYLPASRSGLYQALSAFGQIIAELAKKRAFLTKKIELPNISEPVSDYFLKLSEIKVQKRSFKTKPVNIIAEEIENEILNGKIEFDSKVKKLFFMPNRTDLKLDLSATSSMVSELSPIVSFLRYVVTASSPQRVLNLRKRSMIKRKTPKHLMIIEEPEAHLHPKVQIKMTEIFSKLVDAGIKIIITTHSNYIFNKTNNLILDKKFDIQKVKASVFKDSSIGSEGIELDIDELGIDDENFIDAAESLYIEKSDLIEKLNCID